MIEHYMFDDKNGLWYKREGDYYLPCLSVPAMDKEKIGVWGECRRKHMKEHQNGIYTGMLLTGKLEEHLILVNTQAEEMLSRLVKQMADIEGVTEELKVTDPQEWAGHMNNIRIRAAEVVREELIFA